MKNISKNWVTRAFQQHRVNALTLGGAMSLTVMVCASAVHAQQGDDTKVEEQGIEISVKGGAKRTLIPIAISPAQGDSGKISKRVEELLRKDMELAGYFKLIPSDGLFFDPAKEGMSADKINFSNWANVNAQGLVKVSIKEESKGKVTLDLRLYNVDKSERIRLKFDPSTASKDTFEAQVHDFANAVVEYYTGQRGMFGSQIAYVRRNKSGLKQVYVTDMSGEVNRNVSKNESINLLPSWGAGSLYYTSYQDQNPDLWVYKGGKHSKLSGRRGQNSGASYCGGKLALTLSMGGENTDIYLIDPSSGKQVKRLTDHWAIDTSPTFSPDCSQIAFVSGRSSSPQIYVMDADGSNQRRLTYQGKYNTTPDWSPKGDVIAFTARDERNNFDIFTVDLNGSIERLTQDQGNNEDPSYSPDGRYLVFTSDRGSGRGQGLWIMTSDGQYQREIGSGGGYGSPAWQR